MCDYCRKPSKTDSRVTVQKPLPHLTDFIGIGKLKIKAGTCRYHRQKIKEIWIMYTELDRDLDELNEEVHY
jgi:hypothetical protein